MPLLIPSKVKNLDDKRHQQGFFISKFRFFNYFLGFDFDFVLGFGFGCGLGFVVLGFDFAEFSDFIFFLTPLNAVLNSLI